MLDKKVLLFNFLEDIEDEVDMIAYGLFEILAIGISMA